MEWKTGIAAGSSFAGIMVLTITLIACQRVEKGPEAQDAPAASGNVAPAGDTGVAVRDSAPAIPAPPVASELAGTSWRLVEIQSMDGQTYKPAGQSRYTITFGKDGRALLRVDCNQGSTSWTSTVPSELRFGENIALTRMMCPAASLHDRFVRDLPYVRTYTLKDGHLYLSLMADGAIYEFEPQASAARN